MAEIRVRADNGHTPRTIADTNGQQTFLSTYNIGFQQWPISKLDAAAAKAADNEEAYILDTFKDEIQALNSTYGYVSADVISLYPDTPNLDVILAKFDKEHDHAEDEVRFVVDGHGVFTIHNDSDDIVFDVQLSPGDLLIVPKGTWHWFTLCEDRTIKCIRLYEDPSGWVANYRA